MNASQTAQLREKIRDSLQLHHDTYHAGEKFDTSNIERMIMSLIEQACAAEREETAEDIEHMITGLVESDYSEAGAFANRLCGDIEKKYLKHSLAERKEEYEEYPCC